MEKEISVYDFVSAVSEAADLVSPALGSHCKKVAYLSLNLALEMNLPDDEVKTIFLAAMLHCMGAFSVEERMSANCCGSYTIESDQHAMHRYALLKEFTPLSKATELMKYNQTGFDNSGNTIPIGSYIINLADRAAYLFDEHREIINQVPYVLEKIVLKYHKLHPQAVIAFVRMAKLKFVWIEAFSSSFNAAKSRKIEFPNEITDLESLRSFSKIVAQLVDFRSRYTAAHSSSVAAVAMELAALCGLSERDCRLMEIAGFLHDLGKLAVPNYVLEKTNMLNYEEINVIRKHSYYTYLVLSKIEGLERLAEYTSNHHERLDGNGYPFRIKGNNLCKMSNIMAVADILSALAEDRPYRPAMNNEIIPAALFSMAEDGKLDKDIVQLASENFFRINATRSKAQKQAYNEYAALYKTASNFENADQFYMEEDMQIA